MANGDPTTEDLGAPAPNTGPPPGDPTNAGPPPGGGPILAGLMRQRQSPAPSAPGPGNQAQSMSQIKAAVDMLQSALPGLPAGDKLHSSVLNALRQLSRHLSQGAPGAGVQQTMLQDLLRRTVQNAMFQKILSQRGSQGQETNQDQPAGAAPDMAQAPMPSTPLPGA